MMLACGAVGCQPTDVRRFDKVDGNDLRYCWLQHIDLQGIRNAYDAGLLGCGLPTYRRQTL